MENSTLRSLIDTVVSCSKAGERYCFIIGAGASKASGIKTGGEMAIEWLEELKKNEPKVTQEWIEKEEINIDNLAAYYSKIYGRRFNLNPAQGFIRLQNEMKDAIPSPGYYYLAKILSETQNKLVVTTNFDSLTEDSLFIYKDIKALVITHESLAKYINALSNRPVVIKLHRDLLLQPKNNEADVNKLSEEWKNSLQKIMDIYTPIVIGYGGNDGSLMGFLESVASNDKTIYWCYKKEYTVNKQIEGLLDKYRGFLIPIDDFDDTLHNFGMGFGYNFSKETNQDVTKERATKLDNKYNEWMETRRKILSSKETLSDTESMTYDSFKFLSKSRITELEKLISEDPQNAHYYYNLGDVYFFESGYSKAVEYYTRAIELDPNNADYYNSRGISYGWLKEYEEAIADQTKAIELDPNNAKYYNSRGISYHELKEYEKAVANQTKAIELDPNNADYYNSRGISYGWLKEYEEAVADQTKAIKLDPNNADYYNSRGISYHELKDYEEAVADKTKAIELDPNNAKYYNSRGISYGWLNKYEEAVADQTKAIELDPNNADYYNSRSISYHELKDYEKAVADQTKAIELDPNNADYYNSCSISYHGLKEYEKAVADQTKAIELDPNNADYYSSRGISYHELKEYEKAVADQTKAIELDPNNADYFISRSISYHELNEYEEAVADQTKAIELDPNNANYYLSLARSLCRSNEIDNALSNLNIAISLNDKLPYCYNTRGFINLKKAKLGKIECKSDVLDDLNKAIELDINVAIFYVDRAEYYLYSNKPENVKYDLEKALAIDDRNGRAYFYMARYYEIQANNQEYEHCMSKVRIYRYIPDASDY